MKLAKNTIEKSADLLIKLGEATLVGSVATLFIREFEHFFSIIGLASGILLCIIGLLINNINETKEQ